MQLSRVKTRDSSACDDKSNLIREERKKPFAEAKSWWVIVESEKWDGKSLSVLHAIRSSSSAN